MDDKDCTRVSRINSCARKLNNAVNPNVEKSTNSVKGLVVRRRTDRQALTPYHGGRLFADHGNRG